MVLTRLKHRADEALIPCATARPIPAERPRAIDAPRPSRRPGISAEVLRDLRAADTTPSALGLRRPAAPQPSQSALAMASSAALRTVVGVYDVVAAEVEALLTELAALAPIVGAKAVSL